MDITEPGRQTNTSNSNTTLGNFDVNVVRFCFNYQTRCAIAGILVYVSWIALVNYSWFTWHVILCTLGVSFRQFLLKHFAVDKVDNLTLFLVYSVNGRICNAVHWR